MILDCCEKFVGEVDGCRENKENIHHSTTVYRTHKRSTDDMVCVEFTWANH